MSTAEPRAAFPTTNVTAFDTDFGGRVPAVSTLLHTTAPSDDAESHSTAVPSATQRPLLQVPSPDSASLAYTAHGSGDSENAQLFNSEHEFFEYARTQFSKNPGGGRPEKKSGCVGLLCPDCEHMNLVDANRQDLFNVGFRTGT